MLVPISWLKEFVDIELSVEELAEKLTIAGLEVEHIHYIGIEGGHDKDRLRWSRELLVMGQILKVEQHPNADRLVLATVEYGAEEPEVVVTGAPNLFPLLGAEDLAERGIFSPMALEGAQLYDGHKEGYVKTKLKGRPLRGIHNRCMLCSEKELGISDEHEGIILMEEGPAGAPVLDVLGDAVLEIDIIPNIARCASILGVAREVAALTGRSLRLPDTGFEATGPSIEGKVRIRSEAPELNPRFTATLIQGVDQSRATPDWMQRRLRLAGQRPISLIVDISNYAMLECGQPNHTFDYDFLRKRADVYDKDGPIELITRLPKEGETLTTLDGAEHQLKPFNILVTDPAGVLSLGGIMGGADGEIQDSTTDVLLESAAWDFMNIRRSAGALKINTDAGFRFSRGVHPTQAAFGARRVAKLLHELAGGTVSQDTVDYYPTPAPAVTLALSPKDVLRLGGIELSVEDIKGLLERLEFQVELQEGQALVTAPEHRIDIHGTEDLVEEVCRMYGYDALPTHSLAAPLPPQKVNLPLLHQTQLKDLLVDLGLQEVITYVMTTPQRECRLRPGTSREEGDASGYVALQNPISVDKTVMRRELSASVLDMVADNSRFLDHIALFEWGKEYVPAETQGALPDEKRKLVVAMTGPRQGSHWQDSEAPEALDFFDLKGSIEAVMEACHVEDWRVEAAEHPTYRPGRTAKLFVGKEAVGWVGEIHPLVAEAFEIRSAHPVLLADIDLEAFLPQLVDAHKVEVVSSFPAVQEDIALLVDRSHSAAQVEEQIRKAGGFLLKRVELFDVYEGEQVPEGKRSLAYHLTFQSPSKTLTDKEVGKSRKKIVKQLEKQLGAELR